MQAQCMSAVSINTNHDSQQQMRGQILFYRENEAKYFNIMSPMPKHPDKQCDCDDIGIHKDHIRTIGIA